MVVLFSLSYCCSRQEIDQTYFFFFFNDTATTEIYTLSLHDALPIFFARQPVVLAPGRHVGERGGGARRRRSLAEQSDLPAVALLLAHLRFGERRVERRDELGAMAAEGVARAAVHQRLDHALVAEPQVHALAQ